MGPVIRSCCANAVHATRHRKKRKDRKVNRIGTPPDRVYVRYHTVSRPSQVLSSRSVSSLFLPLPALSSSPPSAAGPSAGSLRHSLSPPRLHPEIPGRIPPAAPSRPFPSGGPPWPPAPGSPDRKS